MIMRYGRWTSKTAFLNGHLKEELYIMQPEGFVDPKNANKVCKLQHSIYGLVQASWSWNIRFNEMIKAFGFMELERRNCTLLDMVRSMMSLTDLPLSFWGYALETATFTLNRAPSKSVETTPYELWVGKKPKLSFLKVWGCDAYVKKQIGRASCRERV